MSGIIFHIHIEIKNRKITLHTCTTPCFRKLIHIKLNVTRTTNGCVIKWQTGSIMRNYKSFLTLGLCNINILKNCWVYVKCSVYVYVMHSVHFSKTCSILQKGIWGSETHWFLYYRRVVIIWAKTVNALRPGELCQHWCRWWLFA